MYRYSKFKEKTDKNFRDYIKCTLHYVKAIIIEVNYYV